MKMPLQHIWSFSPLRRRLFTCFAIITWTACVIAAATAGTNKIEFPKPVPPPEPVESSVSALTNLPLKMLAPGVFELGKVKMNKREQTVSFPAAINMISGPLEYLLVTTWGKTHESVLRTDVEPFQIHVAMLLVGATAGDVENSTNGPIAPPGGQFLSNPSKETIPGDPAMITLEWKAGDKAVKRRGEDLVFNLEKEMVMTNAAWVYNGSRIWDGRFVAQMGGSIVSLITDPDAQINSVSPGHENDHIWMVNTNGVPPMGTPVQVTIRLRSNKKSSL